MKNVCLFIVIRKPKLCDEFPDKQSENVTPLCYNLIHHALAVQVFLSAGKLFQLHGFKQGANRSLW